MLKAMFSPHSLTTMSSKKLFGLAFMSRVIFFILMILFDRVVPEYDSCSHLQVEQLSSSLSGGVGGSAVAVAGDGGSSSSVWWSSLAPFVNHWDGVHFAHIGRFGYSHENVCAFYPFVSLGIMGTYSSLLSSSSPISSSGLDDSSSDSNTLVALLSRFLIPSASLVAAVVGWVCFAASTVLLRELTSHYLLYHVYPAVATGADPEALLIGARAVLIRVTSSSGLAVVNGSSGGRSGSLGESLEAGGGGSNTASDGLLEVKDGAKQKESSNSSSSGCSDPLQQPSGPTRLPTAEISQQNHNSFIGITLLIWLITPALAFSVVAYTENYFSFFSFLGMYFLTIPTKKVTASGGRIFGRGGFLSPLTSRGKWVFPAVVSFTFATTVRSNGILLCGFLLYPLVNTVGRFLLGKVSPLRFLVSYVVDTPERIVSKYWMHVSSPVVETSNNNHRGGGGGGGQIIVQTLAPKHAMQLRAEGQAGPTAEKRLSATTASIFFLSTLSRILSCVLVLAPYFIMNLYCFLSFCTAASPSSPIFGGDQNEVVIEAPHTVTKTPHGTFPSCPRKWSDMYAFVQLKYWGVGWFKYYTVNNIPNFGIATPLYLMVFFALSRTCFATSPTATTFSSNSGSSGGGVQRRRLSFGQIISRIVSSDQLGYLVAMLLIAATRMHVQVVTRFVLSCPALYWLVTDLLMSHWKLVMMTMRGREGEGASSSSSSFLSRNVDVFVFGYISLWGFLSMAMFANFFPWT